MPWKDCQNEECGRSYELKGKAKKFTVCTCGGLLKRTRCEYCQTLRHVEKRRVGLVEVLCCAVCRKEMDDG